MGGNATMNEGIHVLKKAKLKSVSGLKAVAILLLFWWHSPLQNPMVDLGARMCEFFFTASGFLVAYNHYRDDINATFYESVNYVKKKLVEVYPLHILTFAFSFLCIPLSDLIQNTKLYVLTALLNLSLLQSWSINENTFFSYNGVSWFLSSLIFCYFLSPLFLKLLKKMSKYVFVLLLLSFCTRILLEWGTINYQYNLLPINIHVSPIVRSIEFFEGMIIAIIFDRLFKYKNYTDKHTGLWNVMMFTIAEASLLMVTIIIFICFDKSWLRAYYLPLYWMLLIIFSFNCGLISRILNSGIFKFISNIELEIFLIHQLILRIFVKYFYMSNTILMVLSALITTIFISLIYHYLVLKLINSIKEKVVSHNPILE